MINLCGGGVINHPPSNLVIFKDRDLKFGHNKWLGFTKSHSYLNFDVTIFCVCWEFTMIMLYLNSKNRY